MNDVDVGFRLRTLREMAAWSLETTCDFSGGVVDVSRLSRAERNLVSLRPDQTDAIERALRAEIRARQRRAAVALSQRRDLREKARGSAVAMAG